MPVALTTTFGEELQRSWPLVKLRDSEPWRFRSAVWGVDWH